MPDYRDLIDTETWDFIARTESHYPPDAVRLSMAEQRAIYDRMCEAFRPPRPKGLTVTDLPLAGVPCRAYGVGQITLLYAHGGGFVLGGLRAMTMSAPNWRCGRARGSSASIIGWPPNTPTLPPIRMCWP